MSDRCPVCDRHTCKAYGNTSTMEGVADCDASAVDWRTEALRLRTELAKVEAERDAAMWARARGEIGSGDHTTVRGADGQLHHCARPEDVLRAWYPEHADRLIAERAKADG